jgi:hypothetical protein
MHLLAKDCAKPEHALRLYSGLGGLPEPQAPDRQESEPDPCPPPAFGTSQGPGWRQAPRATKAPGPQALPNGRDAVNHSSDKVMHGA